MEGRASGTAGRTCTRTGGVCGGRVGTTSNEGGDRGDGAGAGQGTEASSSRAAGVHDSNKAGAGTGYAGCRCGSCTSMPCKGSGRKPGLSLASQASVQAVRSMRAGLPEMTRLRTVSSLRAASSFFFGVGATSKEQRSNLFKP